MVEAPVPKPNGLSSVTGILHNVRREPIPATCPLTSTCAGMRPAPLFLFPPFPAAHTYSVILEHLQGISPNESV